jgi:squalene-associated FAD-dependent desaturase
MTGTIHVIGAGLAGLSAAARLAKKGPRVIVHEAGAQAGGRCRSYVDTVLNMPIDNGNHVILSGNRAALAYLDLIGARECMQGPASADFPFVDLRSRERWTLRLGDGFVPWWIFAARRRVPNTRVRDYLVLARLLWSRHKTVGEIIDRNGPLYERLVEPFLLATLNNAPPEASAQLAAALLWETIAAGGRACRPLIAMQGLSTAFIDPALAYLKANGAEVRFGHELHRIEFDSVRAVRLDFGAETIDLGAEDKVILAVPPNLAARLLPGLAVPTEFRAIANLHYKIDAPAIPVMTGVVHGTTQWIFAYRGRLSVTISAADALMNATREELAREVWREVAMVAGLPADLPPWKVVRERRATIATNPQQEALRPGAKTAWQNVLLAGDWTATSLPPTIESAIRSGARTAQLAS